MIESSRLRIWLGVAGVAAGRVFVIISNFVQVPILLSAWGVPVYGEWVALTAFAAIASLSNVGFAQASASEIVMRVGAGEREQARKVYVATMVVLLGLVVAVTVIAAALLSVVDAHSAFGVRDIGNLDARVIVGISLVGVVLSFLATPSSSVVSAMLGTGPANMIVTLAKVCELSLICLLAWGGAGPLLITCVPVLSSVLMWGGCFAAMRKVAPWMRFSLSLFDLDTVKRLLRPSLAQFLLFTTVNLLAIQLPRIALSHLGGGAAVVKFSVAFTYCRTARVLSAVLGQSLQVELSRAFSENNLAFLERMVERVCQVNLWVTIMASIFLLAGAPVFFRIWTHGAVAADMPLIAALLVTSVLGTYNDAFGYLLMGINRVMGLAVVHTVATLTGIIFATILYSRWGLTAMAVGLSLPEIGASAVGVGVAAQIFGVSRSRIFLQSIKVPIFFVLEEARNTLKLFRRFV